MHLADAGKVPTRYVYHDPVYICSPLHSPSAAGHSPYISPCIPPVPPAFPSAASPTASPLHGCSGGMPRGMQHRECRWSCPGGSATGNCKAAPARKNPGVPRVPSCWCKHVMGNAGRNACLVLAFPPHSSLTPGHSPLHSLLHSLGIPPAPHQSYIPPAFTIVTIR